MMSSTPQNHANHTSAPARGSQRHDRAKPTEPQAQGQAEGQGLIVRDLSVDYRARGGGWVQAVDLVNLTVAPGSLTAVVGESGSGKTTTASAIIGLLASNGRRSGGSITLDGQELTGLSPKQVNRVRGTQIGYVPQDPGTSLNPLATIGTSVAETLRIHRLATAPEARSRALDLLERVGIDAPQRRIDQYPHELSGGMRQRVLIAAALAAKPSLIVADEPTSALDVTVQKRILDLLDDLRADGTGILLITHDLAVAGERADELLVMRGGSLVESGAASDVFAHPQTDYTRQLLDDAPALSRGKLGSLAQVAGPHAGESTPPSPVVRVQGLTQVYARAEDGRVNGIEDVSFSVLPGTTHAIVGESGSGKSTLASILAGFTPAQSGSAEVAGIDAATLRPRQRRDFHRRVQLVHQNPFSALDPLHTVASSIAEPLRNFKLVDSHERSDRVAAAMERVALDPALATRRPRELSGGQAQRVAIARALVADPQVIVFDEAVSALDVSVQAHILRLLSQLQAESGLTYLFISHDLAVVRELAHTVTVLSAGHQVEAGETAQVFTSPQHAYTRQLLAAIPRPAGTQTPSP